MSAAAAPAPAAARPLIEIHGLSKHYVEGSRLLGRPTVVRAVQEVSLTIAEGENLGLVGESGCGKSTLGRAVLRLIEPTAGRVVIAGTEVTKLKRGELRAFRRTAQMIFQDPYGSLNPRMTIADILSEPLRIHGLAQGPALRARAVELLAQVGLPEDSLRRYPHEFSGGQRQRIGIARALAVRPRFIVADEPVSALDVSIQAQIINLLADIKAREALTFLFISHDLKLVEHSCQRVAVMYLGRLAELASTEALYLRPQHPYTQALLSAVPEPPDATFAAPRKRILLSGELPSPSAPPPGCAFHPRCPLYAASSSPEVCRTTPPPLLPVADDATHQVACHLVRKAAP